LISELFLYLTTKTSKEARAFGHLYESIAINAREKRCRDFWKSHRENCKKFIREFIPKLKQKNIVLILGSGPLHEIPIVELSNQFERIDLVDIVHLKSTKSAYRHYKNLNFIEADLTELEKDIYNEKKIINRVPSIFTDIKYDLIISANLLSQLPNHLASFLEKNGHNSAESLEKFKNQICQDHISYLKNFNAPTILITDTERSFHNPSGELINKENSFNNLQLPKPANEWEWNLAPIPEVSKEYSIKMKVSAFILNF
jgi:hypothetical protein